ncbi:MAG: hypothetical protein M3362_01750 [Acidobacteriota bacterium]|nr:hypothetical protein [Acidobacteriota bacterium]
MSIQDFFAHWIKTAAEVGKVSADKYDGRISTINQITEDIGEADALNLVRIYCNLIPANGDILQDFARQFQGNDPAFDIHDKPFIFQILAAISLIQVLNKANSRSADAVGLALSTKTLQWTHKTLPDEAVSVDLETAAKKYLHEKSNRMRQVSAPTPISFSEKKINGANISDLKTAAEQSPTVGVTTTAMHTYLSSLNKAISSVDTRFSELVKPINAALESLYNTVKVNTEESNIYWWLAGAWSRDLEQPFEKLTAVEACLLLGKELSDLTEFQPGHNSAKGFLHRMFKFTKGRNPSATKEDTYKVNKGTVSIREVINSVPTNWETDWVNDSQAQTVIDFCPLHYALQKRRGAGDSIWHKLFEQQTGIKSTSVYSLLDLSYQFYQERLLINT